MNRFESKEDYLECILMLSEENMVVRAIDVAKKMNLSEEKIDTFLNCLGADEILNKKIKA